MMNAAALGVTANMFDRFEQRRTANLYEQAREAQTYHPVLDYGFWYSRPGLMPGADGRLVRSGDMSVSQFRTRFPDCITSHIIELRSAALCHINMPSPWNRILICNTTGTGPRTERHCVKTFAAGAFVDLEPLAAVEAVLKIIKEYENKE